MKTKVLLVLALGVSVMGFAQKDEIKEAEKALKKGDAAAAKASLESASSTIGSADERMQAQYYAVLGNANYDLAKKGDASAFEPAVEAFQKVVSIEEASGKEKYTGVAKEQMSAMTADLVNSAVEDNNNKKFMEAAEKLYMSYKLSPMDTIYLYYAASSAVNAQEYEPALKYYNELKDIKYDGSSVSYTAVDVATGETVTMDKATRDLYVKAGTHKDPKEEVSPSKRPEIVKNIAMIYQQMGDNEKALAAYSDARAVDPNDVNLVLGEANLYYAMGDKDKFVELMGQASEMAPDNPDLLYNIGVINMEQGNLEAARDAYKKALAVDPGYINALLNLSTTYVNEGNGLIDEMNSLGTSKADIAKYDELKNKKDDLFREGATVLEDALKSNPDNEGVLTQLKNIYGALGDTENFMRIKKLLGE
ncbi:tetratricopeptide repeat protein [Flagellimonas zhangzhouensis]|uniref:Tetratricopeptide repeat-containing protein n=1 Tax=Flagellimonas zhangzhouensis TaxID=1073328 RepID=A0A1H2XTP9_9FLAO|nr:tetratricopeptide repeat protein [Allomuricauda zhangzhouensis]SDQ91530.1 Tetratricopeptide repeat-containing protein [Allomuricauda zhangzhouensis]SDW96226.1 Tetratricopeptide repeat-containing protein [Allomuricauda zhangzhouensis]